MLILLASVIGDWDARAAKRLFKNRKITVIVQDNSSIYTAKMIKEKI